MVNIETQTVFFPGGRQAHMVWASCPPDGPALVRALSLPPPRAVLLLHGGASDMSSVVIRRVRRLIEEMARVVAEENVTLIDGGTQAGVMAMMGEACADAGARSPLIGVCPAALVCWPEGPTGPGRVPLEPNHTHFVLTPGDRWGDETETMFALAATLSSGSPSLAILINGGTVARQEMVYNVRQGREIIVIQGSGRLADAIAAAVAGKTPQDGEIAFILGKGHITLLDVHENPTVLASQIRRKLLQEDTKP